MRINSSALVFLATLALAAAKKSKPSHHSSHKGAKDGSTSGSPSKKDYQKARAEIGDPSVWKEELCDKDPGQKDRWGCCNSPSGPQFAKGWSVELLSPLDDACFVNDKFQDHLLTYRAIPGNTTHDTASAMLILKRISNSSELSDEDVISFANPLCPGNGEIRRVITQHDELAKKTGNDFDEPSMWQTFFAPLPKSKKDIGKLIPDKEFFSKITYDEEVGAQWVAPDCDKLAQDIKAGKVNAPKKNRFAIAARAGNA